MSGDTPGENWKPDDGPTPGWLRMDGLLRVWESGSGEWLGGYADPDIGVFCATGCPNDRRNPAASAADAARNLEAWWAEGWRFGGSVESNPFEIMRKLKREVERVNAESRELDGHTDAVERLGRLRGLYRALDLLESDE